MKGNMEVRTLNINVSNFFLKTPELVLFDEFNFNYVKELQI